MLSWRYEVISKSLREGSSLTVGASSVVDGKSGGGGDGWMDGWMDG